MRPQQDFSKSFYSCCCPPLFSCSFLVPLGLVSHYLSTSLVGGTDISPLDNIPGQFPPDNSLSQLGQFPPYSSKPNLKITYIHTCMHTCIHIYILAYTHRCMHTRIYFFLFPPLVRIALLPVVCFPPSLLRARTTSAFFF